LLDQRVGTPAQQKWISKLMGYAFIVEYKKDKDNLVVDALSKKEGKEGASSSACTLCIISFPTPKWIAKLKDSYESNPNLHQLLQDFQIGREIPKEFTMQNGLLLYKGRIYLGPNSHLKSSVLHYVHNSPLGEHSGYLKTLHRIQQDFYWPGLRKDLRQHIRECDTYQRIKHETCKPAGLLQPLPIPSIPWLDVSMDFIEGIPKSH